MTNDQFDIPLLYLVFNRPEHTRRSFEVIRAHRPKQLFVAADGPRADVPSDRARTEEVRRIASAVDWPCAFSALFRSENLGSRRGIPLAVEWFFKSVPFGIIIEDDCLATDDFFDFCRYALHRFERNRDVASISGTNFHAAYGQQFTGTTSYYFSRYSHTWGWATWRDRWFSLAGINFTENPDEHLRTCFANAQLQSPISRWYWRRIFYGRVAKPVPNWDYRWLFSVWHSNKLSIIPQSNLVTNIGHDAYGTNTRDPTSPFSHLPLHALSRPYLDPLEFVRDREADDQYETKIVIRKMVVEHAVKKHLLNVPMSFLKRNNYRSNP